jgi:S1-C subfamily serine protease
MRLFRSPFNRSAAGSAPAASWHRGAVFFGALFGALLGAVILSTHIGNWQASAQKPATERPLPPGLLEDERNTIELFRRVAASVVHITNIQLQRDIFSLDVMQVPAGTGSGFLWDRDGHVVTNFHVIQDGNAFSVTLGDGTSYDAKVVGAAPEKDLAVLQIKARQSELVPVEPGDSGSLVVGQKVLAIGNPFGLDQTLTTGVISALGREVRSVANTVIQDVIQTDASINPGNSGGPLLDSGGRLIGINTMIYSTSGSSAGIGFAVPVNTVKRIVPQLIQKGSVTRASLGIAAFPDNLTQRWGIKGVPVQKVTRGGAAAKAGLEAARLISWGRVELRDIIVAIDDQKVDSYDDLYSILDHHEPGDRVTLKVLREDHTRQVKIVLQADESPTWSN